MRKRDLPHNADETIAAVSTPIGEGGIGIVRLSGKKALSVADKIFVSKDNAKPSGFKTYTTHYGHIVRRPSLRRRVPPRNDKNAYDGIIDEVILTVMKAPGSYTREDIVEINCHGGILALRQVLDLALGMGVRLAEPGEFTKRAFINGRIDLAQAEAVGDIIRSKTESSMKVAVGQLEGGLSARVKNLKESLLDILGEVEAQIDFSEEDLEIAPKEKITKGLTGVSKEIKKLVDNAWKGMILREGIMCVICGRPNTGKSSLMNVLLRRNRVIVTPVPGTTRDAIEEEINLGGIPVRVVDTAGIARAKDIVEEHGIRKSKSYINMADLILFMVDRSKGWSKADEEILRGIKGKNFIVIANKSDLAGNLDLRKVRKITGKDEIIEVSLLKRKNVGKIEEALLRKVWHGEIVNPAGTFVTNLRQRKDLERAGLRVKKCVNTFRKETSPSPEIVASDLREAIFFLSSVLGDTVEPDILDRIFSRFCIGK